MKALHITAFGTEATLADLPAPVPGPGQVVVDVVAAAANPLDLKIASGAMHDYFPAALPYVLGTDFSGRVATPGTGWQLGDPVIGRLDPVDGGAFAEQLVIDAADLVPAPSGISLETAAGIPTAAATAWQALVEVANVHRGQTVLVHAAAGGVGSFAVQIARRLGARVVATASGDGVAIAEKLGADQVLDYRQVAFDSRLDGVDVVLDTVGGEVGARSQQVLKPGGLLVTTPAPAEGATFVFHSSDAARLAKAAELGVEVLVDRTYPLADGAQALAYLGEGHARGKVLLSVA
ncbi:NADP-dependent oxidoreductase [Amycolatopsis echigonensis]|uniref:NADP-dependent oxidoreductase n=1 Tax=Amycolatopsis echigonensis TaxID=2576905 RepID=A0A8E1W2H6_9PSEU|nr:NADP-dependent oxidoreductase [Amycolatopsis echigonensis]MBB2502573.1 NADP-dependent oxidoreductase [Amycolatopsis echigonensis]